MPSWLMWLLFVVGIVIFIVAIVFFVAYIIRKRRVAKQKRLFCEIYLKKGGRASIVRSLDDHSFTIKKERVPYRYFIIKEAIQEEFKETFRGPVIFRYIQFEEGNALPFIMADIDGEKAKRFVGSERIEQFLMTNIWEQVGGLGKMSGTAMWGGLAVIVIGIIIFAFLFLK